MRLKGDLMSRGKDRTVQDWEAEKRELPEYLLRLMKYRAEVEYMVKNKS